MQILKTKKGSFWTRHMRCLYLCCSNSINLGSHEHLQQMTQHRSLLKQNYLKATKWTKSVHGCSSCYNPSSVIFLNQRQYSTAAVKDSIAQLPMSMQAGISLLPYRLLNGASKDLKWFLEEIGSEPREARYWLKQFQHMTDTERPFAVIQIGDDVIKDQTVLEKLGLSLAFLHRNSMSCILVYGINRSENGDVSLLKVQENRTKITESIMKIVTALELHGAPARPLFGGSTILQTACDNSAQNGPMTINHEPVDWCLKSAHIPVISAIGETPSGQLSLIDSAVASEELAKVYKPLKLMYVNTTGGIKDNVNKVVPNINLPCDLEECSSRPWYTPAVKEQIARICSLLKELPIQSSAVITSADTVLTELFTHHGSGTFFKITEPIHCYKSFNEVDMTDLIELLTKPFGRELRPEYFSLVTKRLHTLYLSEQYNTAAIITNEPGMEVPYLDKFVISSKAQGQGTSDMLWDSIRADLPKLFWRSRSTNKINPWYFKKCDGSWANGEWIVFWYGISHKQSSQLIDFALTLETSFVEHDEQEESVLKLQ